MRLNLQYEKLMERIFLFFRDYVHYLFIGILHLWLLRWHGINSVHNIINNHCLPISRSDHWRASRCCDNYKRHLASGWNCLPLYYESLSSLMNHVISAFLGSLKEVSPEIWNLQYKKWVKKQKWGWHLRENLSLRTHKISGN